MFRKTTIARRPAAIGAAALIPTVCLRQGGHGHHGGHGFGGFGITVIRPSAQRRQQQLAARQGRPSTCTSTSGSATNLEQPPASNRK